MTEPIEEGRETGEQDIEILVDVLRQCFMAEKARYYLPAHQNELFIEIEGLDELSQEEISETAEPVLEEFNLDFDEILLIPMNSY
jgi:hypothetical protein